MRLCLLSVLTFTGFSPTTLIRAPAHSTQHTPELPQRAAWSPSGQFRYLSADRVVSPFWLLSGWNASSLQSALFGFCSYQPCQERRWLQLRAAEEEVLSIVCCGSSASDLAGIPHNSVLLLQSFNFTTELKSCPRWDINVAFPFFSLAGLRWFLHFFHQPPPFFPSQLQSPWHWSLSLIRREDFAVHIIITRYRASIPKRGTVLYIPGLMTVNSPPDNKRLVLYFPFCFEAAVLHISASSTSKTKKILTKSSCLT